MKRDDNYNDVFFYELKKKEENYNDVQTNLAIRL